jgi:sulfate permease, SulP family
MIGLISFGELRRYYRVNRSDWVFFMGAMLGILFLGIIQGILIGVVLSLLALIARASKPGIRRLGLERASGSYQDATLQKGLENGPGRACCPGGRAAVLRRRGPIPGRTQGDDRQRGQPHQGRRDRRGRDLQTDTDGADIVSLVATELRARGTTLALARVEPSILDLWTRAGAIDAVGAERVFGTVREAVTALQPTLSDPT